MDSRLLLAGLVLFGVVLAVVDNEEGTGPLAPFKSAATTVFAPIQSLAFNIASPVVNFSQDISELGSKDAVIEQLRLENAELIRELGSSEDARRRAKELDELLQLAGVAEMKIKLAQVISTGSSSGFGATALIDIGTADDVKVGMNVVTGPGLVGRIINVQENYSTVLILTDATSTVGARVAGSGKVGFLSGTGKPFQLRLNFIDPKADVKVGDKLVSYGVEKGIFAPGIPLGEVIEVRAAQGTTAVSAIVRPFIDVTALDLVGVVISKPRTDPRDGLLPTPTVQPTVTVTITVAPGDAAFIVEPTPTQASPKPTPSSTKEQP